MALQCLQTTKVETLSSFLNVGVINSNGPELTNDLRTLGKINLVPRVSHLNAWGERGETLVGSGHVSPRKVKTLGRGPL